MSESEDLLLPSCKSVKTSLLQRTCLKPHFSLQRQLFLTFGLVGAAVTVCVMLTSIVTTIYAGNEVKSESRQNLVQWARNSAGKSSRYAADTISKKLDNFHGLVSILVETTQDRFVGYPYHPDYEDDSLVPFFDTLTERNRYPLGSAPLPLDWQIKSNLDDIFHHEHVHHRKDWYPTKTETSTASAIYWMQGQCDPTNRNPSSLSYYPNCTDSNNNVATGGVVQPTPTNAQIARKAADLNFVLKPLYEYHQDVKSLSIGFANSGAGSGVLFPGSINDASTRYQSIGCDWMRSKNPRNTSRPLASEDEIRRCHKRGETVEGREYNVLERDWCRKEALEPDKSHTMGPFPDAIYNVWMIGFGRAVYDRVTDELIACILVDVGVEQIADIIDNVTASPNSQTALVRWDEKGTVVASSTWNPKSIQTVPTISNIGMGVDIGAFKKLKSLVDFEESWDPAQVQKIYEETFSYIDGKMIFGFPIPVPPATYDPDYKPDFMVVISLDESEVFAAADTMDEAVDQEISDLIMFTLVVGLAGLAVLTIAISAVSHHITKPLNWMNKIGDQIVDKYGQELDEGIDVTHIPIGRFVPKTEIVVLACEFQKMVLQFSGTGTASVVKQQLTEMKNPFILFFEFQDLYNSRQERGFKYGYDVASSSTAMIEENGVVTSEETYPTPRYGSLAFQHRRHLGPNVPNPDGDSIVNLSPVNLDAGNRHRVLRSSLFWWIVGLIVTPLLFTTIVIAVIVTLTISTELDKMVTDVEDASLETYVSLEMSSLTTAANMRASYATEVMAQSVRDLYVLTRVAGWLLFGAIRRSNSFTEMTTAAEECKVFPANGSCPFLLDEVKAPCDCNWVGRFNSKCHKYSGTDTRYLQKTFFEGQSQDSWPNGNRNSSRYPFADTPETTEFWSDQHNVPGSEKGDFAVGYETTYDRLRAISALSVIQIPLFNYDLRRNSDKPFANYIGFDADGMLLGYAGCLRSSTAQFSHWNSTVENAASELSSDLCPIGKYGFDSRCRAWYVTGKKIGTRGGAPLHVTPPYMFTGGSMGQSCTLPLIDPKTEKLVGVSLADFVPQSIFDSLRKNTPLTEGGFPIVITPEEDEFDSNTVVGPNCELCESNSSIEDLVLPHDASVDDSETENEHLFENVLEDMLDGNSSRTTFTRSDADGKKEKVYIAYAPVKVQSLRPMDSSDISRGVKRFESLIYSLALAQPEPGLLAQFHNQNIDETLNRQVNVSIAVLTALIVIAALIVAFISSRVTVSVTVPILHLLDVVQKINRGDIKDDIPIDVNGGSREVSRVCGTFNKLYKVVRFANTAYFAGDLEDAYLVLVESLEVFTHLNNKKAMAVANNNLGTTMLTAYRTMQSTGSRSVFDMSKEQIVAKGIAHFNVAIELGEEAYDKFHAEEGWSKRCLVFMQQLSNRYFNRAMFLLTVRGEHGAPEDAERLGFSDLTVAKDMDTEVVSQSENEGVVGNVNEHFNIVVGRIRGLLTLMDMSYPDEWDMEELFEDAIGDLMTAIKYPAHSLFRDVGPAGRMQQIDAALIKYVEIKGKGIAEAARIAIRMLVEDEYILPDAGLCAIETITHYVEVSGTGSEVPTEQTRKLLADYQAAFAAKELQDANRRASSMRRGEEKENKFLDAITDSCRGDVTMEAF